ncbi:MAG: hydrolase [Planctomycetes bacterium]|jgi:imidazolonepropionase-like amidohydrolase|nr:hydrolase [Planctomycetota bacterium]
MIVLSNVKKLYDGTSASAESLHSAVDLCLENGRVHALEPHRPDRPLGAEDVSIDAQGYTVTPGLVDCHGHVTVLGLDSKSMDLMNTQAALVWVEKVLYTTLVDGGVTTMRDVGGATDLMKRLVAEGTCLGPRLKISICMLSSTGGHADFRGPDRCHGALSKLWPEAPGRPSSIVDGPLECRKRVREIAACGADLIKICASPGVASPGDKLEHRDFHPDEVEAITEEASARGLRVAAHAHSRSGIELAIAAGVHDLQHISFMDERMVEIAFEKKCTVTPTSWVVDELTRAEGLSDFVMEKVKQVAECHARAVGHAASGELPILMGTDPVLPGMHGRNYMELVYLIRDGLSPLATWYGATGLAAREIGQDDTGTLTPGQRADLLIARGDVIEEPELLDAGALEEVVQDGFGHRGLRGFPQREFRTTVLEGLGTPS